MDRTLLFSFSMGLGMTALAQPTLEFPSSAPTPGTSFEVNYAAPTAPGANGPDQTWDFASLAADSSGITYVELPEATPLGNEFPSATAAVVAPTGTDYFRAAAGLLELQGISFLGQTAPLDNSAAYLPYPCTYQSSWEDDFGGTLEFQGFPLQVTGTVIGIADGYGTLLLPEGPVNDVLRVRRITSTTIQTFLGDFVLEDETFAFYTAGIGIPVLEISNTTGDVLGTPIDLQTLEWVDLTTVGVAEGPGARIGLEAFPNPATDQVQVNISLGGGAQVSVELFDAQGRQVRALPLNTGSHGVHTHFLDIQGLPSGMYMLRVVDNDGRSGTVRIQVL